MTLKTYKEPRWLKLRAKVLRRDNYMDQYLFRYGKFRQAELVHHIFPVEAFPGYQFEEWNLISITKRTHDALHDTDGSLSKKGVELLVRTARRNKIPIPYQYINQEKKRTRNSYIAERGINDI